MAIGGYRSGDVMHLRGGYREPYVITAPILDHKNGHYLRPNMVIFKYLDLKKDVDLDVHVRMFNFVIKTDIKTFEKYIINVFSYMLRDTTLDWCHNYVVEFPDYTISELTHAFCKHHWKIQNDEQIHMELKNMKHQENKKVEVHYERI